MRVLFNGLNKTNRIIVNSLNNLYFYRPISYNRINNLLSSVGGKVSLATTIKYIDYCEEAWLLLRPRNFETYIKNQRVMIGVLFKSSFPLPRYQVQN